MGRVNYTLLDRYSLSVTVRSDGSSRLAPGNKWATFPSVGLAWQLGDESFMRRFNFLNSLKVRGSYGTTGNTVDQPVSDARHAVVAALHVRHDARPRLQAGQRFRIPDLGWEKTDQTDIGVDYAMLEQPHLGHGRLLQDEDARPAADALLPVTSGFTSTLQNVGATKNTRRRARHSRR